MKFLKDNRKLSVFENNSLRTFMRVSYMNYFKMDDIRSKLWIPNKIRNKIKKKRLKWFSPLVCKDNYSSVNYSYTNDFTKRRLRGQLSEQWSGLIKVDIKLLLLIVEILAKDWTKGVHVWTNVCKELLKVYANNNNNNNNTYCLVWSGFFV